MAERNLYNLKLVQFLAVLSMQAHIEKNQTVELHHVGTKQMHYILKKNPHRYEENWKVEEYTLYWM